MKVPVAGNDLMADGFELFRERGIIQNKARRVFQETQAFGGPVQAGVDDTKCLG
jgi:hypothetical protein